MDVRFGNGAFTSFEKAVLATYGNGNAEKCLSLREIVKTDGPTKVAENIAKNVSFFTHTRLLIQTNKCGGWFRALLLQIVHPELRRGAKIYNQFLLAYELCSSVLSRGKLNATQGKADSPKTPLATGGAIQIQRTKFTVLHRADKSFTPQGQSLPALTRRMPQSAAPPQQQSPAKPAPEEKDTQIDTVVDAPSMPVRKVFPRGNRRLPHALNGE
ncbi:MAG: hypothetical protein LBF26_01970 [Puniceicoccales bacterium]|jgi:hypothetical protein|nr:hypothetical protein [Puniceicoccales bacterium]